MKSYIRVNCSQNRQTHFSVTANFINIILPKSNLMFVIKECLNTNFKSITRRLIPSIQLLCFSILLLFGQSTFAQTYTGSVTFGDSNQFSFDFSVECDSPPTSATLTVTFTTDPPIDLVPQIWDGGTIWQTMNGSDPYTLDLTGLTACDFSFFFWFAYEGGGLFQSSEAVTPDNTTLPITLTNFSVNKEEDGASLEWQTSLEVNSDYFDLEMSLDGRNWENVDRVEAAGISYSPINYEYLITELSLIHI